MIRQMRAWWYILQLGSTRRVARQIEAFFRHQMLRTFAAEGFFEFLKEPHTYGQILAKFDYMDSDYTRELFDLLVNDAEQVLLKEDEVYRLNPALTESALLAGPQSGAAYESFSALAEGMARNIPLRLRRKPVEFSLTFQAEGREMMQKFDKLLSIRLYSLSRKAAFALLTRQERQWLRGKALLDIGCGSGREPAELWLNLGGDVRLTAIDPVPALLQRAQENFLKLLDEIDPQHLPVTDANRPTFRKASATQLPYKDNSFDAAFYSQILHWTSSPRQAIGETVRVVKPGGLIFGVQIIKPYASAYTDIIIRSNEDSHGFFWKEEHIRWYADRGLPCEVVTPAGGFRVRDSQRPLPLI